MKRFIFLILAATIMLACEGPKGENGKDLKLKKKTGTVIGFIQLFNNFGDKESDFSGVKIELKNTYSTFTVNSDIKGKYTIENCPIGLYNLTYTKNGYSMYKSFGFINIGDTCYPNKRDIYAKTTTKVNTDFTIAATTTSMKISGTFAKRDPVNITKQAIAFISTDKNVSPTNYEYYNYYLSSVYEGYGTYYFYIAKNRYKSGTTVYMVVYGTTNRYNDFYYNSNKNIRVYSNLSEKNSGLITVEMP